MFYQNHSVINVVCSCDILQFNLKENHWTWTWRIMNCLTGFTGLGLTLKYVLGLNSKNYWTSLLASDWFYNILELALKITQTALLDLDWFYDILDLDLKKTWTNLLDSDSF